MQIQESNPTFKTASTPALRLSHEEVASLAARNWENRGRPMGRDMEIWLEAEQQLQAARRSPMEKNRSMK